MYQEREAIISTENVKISMEDRTHGTSWESREIHFCYSAGDSKGILEREIMLGDLVETFNEASGCYTQKYRLDSKQWKPLKTCQDT